jgi:hypothetical protein
MNDLANAMLAKTMEDLRTLDEPVADADASSRRVFAHLEDCVRSYRELCWWSPLHERVKPVFLSECHRIHVEFRHLKSALIALSSGWSVMAV